MGGTNEVNQAGVYGTEGAPSAANIPPYTYRASTWTDAAGAFWMFAGGANICGGTRAASGRGWTAIRSRSAAGTRSMERWERRGPTISLVDAFLQCNGRIALGMRGSLAGMEWIRRATIIR